LAQSFDQPVDQAADLIELRLDLLESRCIGIAEFLRQQELRFQFCERAARDMKKRY